MQKWHSTVYHCYQVMGMFERKKKIGFHNILDIGRQDGTEIMHTYMYVSLYTFFFLSQTTISTFNR